MHLVPLCLAAAVRGDAPAAATARAARAAHDPRTANAFVLEALAGDAATLQRAHAHWSRIASEPSRAGAWWLQCAYMLTRASTAHHRRTLWTR